MTDAPATYTANPRIWGQVGAPGTLFAPLAHIFRRLPDESALVAAPACCPDLPVAAQLLVSASDAPRCPECAGWWSIGDGPVDRALRCPHCAARLEPPEPGA